MGPTDRLELAIAASHPAIRDALARLLEREPGIHVVGVLADRRAAARHLLQHHPHVMVVAFADALRDEAAAIRELTTLAPETALVVASTATTDAHKSLAAEAGAAAFVPLDGPTGALVDAVRSVAPHS